jgi:hypothetical protein
MAILEQQEIGEIDVVAFIKAIDKDETLTRDPGEDRGIGQWPVGAKGTVVSDFGDHKMIEIFGRCWCLSIDLQRIHKVFCVDLLIGYRGQSNVNQTRTVKAKVVVFNR